ncbi:MAG TPA: ImmA/IrrE family metallo-endopeptidase [Gaiellaceae bacterium]|nr:ImmA/IrrE family metallo-endopeptidase [Gaiellaceae bacterium]
MGATTPVAAARFARSELGFGDDSPLTDAMRAIESAGRTPVTVLPLPDGVAGAYGKKSGRGFIFVSSNDHPPRRRFTLAHEYGHHVLNHVTAIDREEDIYGSPKSRREQEANAFAAEFLAPRNAVEKWMEARQYDKVDLKVLVDLATSFGISAQAARYRLTEARFIPRVSDQDRFDASIHSGEHLQLQRRDGIAEFSDSLALERIEIGGRRMPERLRLNVIRSYEHGLADVDRAAAALRQSADELTKEFAALGIAPIPDDDEPDY